MTLERAPDDHAEFRGVLETFANRITEKCHRRKLRGRPVVGREIQRGRELVARTPVRNNHRVVRRQLARKGRSSRVKTRKRSRIPTRVGTLTRTGDVNTGAGQRRFTSEITRDSYVKVVGCISRLYPTNLARLALVARERLHKTASGTFTSLAARKLVAT